ncbi:putative uncharacterized protein [Brevibacillus laterosporus GI-9]|uniref:hypothetical protein n=1 Tax=Brevibacillus laterosporus TaxID=1465 RepID=UPI00024054B6|nr:hypothetical protein [Brevibacillus laterosporus]CCF16893.1 putative uncharacterized protein [Brevibacillus laterosporus GI-9]
MDTLKFSNWPFKQGEQVSIHWFRSPYRKGNGEWVFDVVFRRANGAIDQIATIPWGALPWLRFGQYVIDGKPMKSMGRGKIERLSLKQVQNGIVMPARKAFRKEMYKLFFKENYEELCWVIEYECKDLVVPCIEIIRAFLTPSRFFANAIVDPIGLNSLIEDTEDTNGNYYIKISKTIPKSYITKGLVTHLVWLYNDHFAKKAWDQVYQSFFRQAMKQNQFNPVSQLSSSNKISVTVPLFGNSEWIARVIENKDTILVLNILDASSLVPPFRDITVEHDGVVIRNINSQKAGSRVVKRSKSGDDHELDESLLLSFDAKVHPQIDVQSTRLRFNFKPMVRINETESIQSFPLSKEEHDNDNPSSNNLVTTTESVSGGKRKPVEFRPLQVEYDLKNTGLEDFVEAIKELQKLIPEASIDLQIGELPGDKGISFVTESVRRKYANVLIRAANYSEVLIVEIGRPDQYSISTLMVSLKGFENFESDMRKEVTYFSLNVLIQNNGSWNRETFKNDQDYAFSFLKHMSQDTPLRWALKIKSRLLL